MTTFKSEIDGEFFYPTMWRVHLVRKADVGDTNHVFLLLEGIVNNKRFLWFADFVHTGDLKTSEVRTHTINEGAAHTDYGLIHGDNPYSRLAGARFAHHSWPIPQDQAKQLQRSVQQQEGFGKAKERGRYQILGADASSAASSSVKGHNCYTWARDELRDLGGRFATDKSLEVTAFDKAFVALPKKHLPDTPAPRANSRCMLF